ncbi:pyruvate dehydrogenase complex dihydrolipoamide acetyltransferase [Chakrabartia godavariana]|nr:pyruvate dehydrogenase complex dihydrolipoamide acetyltransferase [Chakrabartia godavariana]
MPIELKMPALSPTMEEGTLAKWLVKEGDSVSSGDILAEIETDKATMEFEAVDEGVVGKILIPEGTDGVKVGTVIALIQGEDDGDVSAPKATPARAEPVEPKTTEGQLPSSAPKPTEQKSSPATSSGQTVPVKGDRVIASPLAKRIAEQRGVNLTGLSGSGPNGRIIKADVEAAQGGVAKPVVASAQAAAAPAPAPIQLGDIATPHEVVKLSNMRKTIARRLTEAKQTIPHIYLTVDVRLDALLKLRTELNASLEGRGVKLSVNDMLIKALGLALVQVPKCNVSFAGDQLVEYKRADISVAVSVPNGLITPIITDANSKAISAISTEMGDLATRAKDGKLQPHEYQGGTASLSNMGMFGIKQFDAVINPPQGMIMAIGAGEKRPFVIDDSLQIATVMSATGSFDHRAIDGADGAQLMKAFRELCETPLGLVA